MLDRIFNVGDDIKSEFYVDKDGKVFAKSIRAVARLVGVNESTIRNHLINLAAGKTSIKGLEPFVGIDFTCGVPIPDIVVAAFAEYYAFDSKVSNDTARSLYRVMAAVGVRAWFQQQLGYQDKLPKTYKEAVKALLESIEEKEKLEAEKAETDEENKVLEGQNKHLNGQINAIKEVKNFNYFFDLVVNKLKDSDYPEGITVAQFIIEWNDNPDHAQEIIDEQDRITISRRAASFYRQFEKSDVPKNKYGRALYAEKKVAYIIATVNLVLEGI